MKKFIYLFVLFIALKSKAQQVEKLPIIKSNTDHISYRSGNAFYKDSWTVIPTVKPDIYVTQITEKSKKVTFITDIDSISFDVKPGKKYQFIVLLNGKDSAYTEIEGKKLIKAATFTNQYKRKHLGKTYTEIPEVYELVNVMLAISPTLLKDEGIVFRNSDYYKDVINHFMPFVKDSEIKLMDSLMVKNQYFPLKMDAYTFEFDRKGKIVQSKIYDRVSWGVDNTLRPYLNVIQSFSDKTNFRDFYNKHQKFYEEQIIIYRDSINTAEMISWLRKNFPTSDYNSFKIIWSPLVGGNQSANWFEDNGFKEMQAHVNFPYLSNTKVDSVSAKSNEIKRGNIVFTEINHSFINPEADKPQYLEIINSACKDLKIWEEGNALKNYPNPRSCFNEYMNWALVSLRYLDYVPKEDFEKLMTTVENWQVKRRGFKHFKEFNTFLVDLYRNRKLGTTIADLYPQIVDWFVKANEKYKLNS